MHGFRFLSPALLVLALLAKPGLQLLGAQQVKLHEPVYKCDTEAVQLTGELLERTFYGPPGFGETPAQDAREKVSLLKLANPITVEAAQDAKAKNSTCLETFSHIRRVQLWFLHMPASDHRNLLHKTVLVSGTLDEAVAPSDHISVTMDVRSMRLLAR